MALIRLDKLLSQSGERSRSEAVKLIRAGRVTVDGIAVQNPAYKVDTAQTAVALDGQPLRDAPYQTVMLHKPAGVVCAVRDRADTTVMDLLPKAMRLRDVMPVGRLDKDTTGLLLLTSDGTLAHRLLSPKAHVWKEYRATVDGRLTQKDVQAFKQGVPLRDFTALPAELVIESASQTESRAIVRIREGKFHQVKRMFGALDLQVTALERRAFGPLTLDIPQGEYRLVTPHELEALYTAVQMDGEGRHG